MLIGDAFSQSERANQNERIIKWDQSINLKLILNGSQTFTRYFWPEKFGIFLPRDSVDRPRSVVLDLIERFDRVDLFDLALLKFLLAISVWIFTVAFTTYLTRPVDSFFLSDLTDSVSLSWFRCFVKKFFRRDNELSLKLDLDGVNRSKVPTLWAI